MSMRALAHIGKKLQFLDARTNGVLLGAGRVKARDLIAQLPRAYLLP